MCGTSDESRAREGNQEETAQDNISVTEQSVGEVAFILLDRYDRNLTEVTNSRQSQPCRQKNLASKTPLAPRVGAEPSASSRFRDTYSVNRAYTTV